jgi:hypothetical protein
MREGQVYPFITMMALKDEDLVVQEIVFPAKLNALLDIKCYI